MKSTLIKVAMAGAVLLPGTAAVANQQADAAVSQTTKAVINNYKALMAKDQKELAAVSQYVAKEEAKKTEIINRIKTEEREKIKQINLIASNDFAPKLKLQQDELTKINTKYANLIAKINADTKISAEAKSRAFTTVSQDKDKEVRRLNAYIQEERTKNENRRLNAIKEIRAKYQAYENQVNKDYAQKLAQPKNVMSGLKSKIAFYQAEIARLSK